MLPSELVTSSAPGIRRFRGSMASLHDPLPTLRPAPRGTRRTARGRCDSLRLHRRGLAPPTPCRSPGALPTVLPVTVRGKADHLAQECRIGALLQQFAKRDLVLGHRGALQVRVACCNPTLPGNTAVTAAVDKSPACARLSA